jgi:hypothetical protein
VTISTRCEVNIKKSRQRSNLAVYVLNYPTDYTRMKFDITTGRDKVLL